MIQKQERDIVIVSAVRSPSGKFGGAMKDLPVYHIGSTTIQGALKSLPIDLSQIQSEIDDCIIGCCRHTGNGTNPARTAARFAGLSEIVPATTITMACASGMRAVILGAQAILAGDAHVAVTGGMESMSTIPYILMDTRWKGFRHGHKTLLDGWYDSRDPYLDDKGTGASTEDLISKHNISRREQDEFSYESHKKALEAQNAGLFDEEIIPFPEISRDETIRIDTSLEKLATLEPAFMESGTLTAGNSSSLSDGAAILIVTSRKKAHQLGLKPLFKIVSYSSGAVDNETMGEGPSVVLPQALKKAGMTLKDVDFLELNEAFAGMVLANERILKWDRAKLNRNGGAIALGHPVGCSGARILVTLYYLLKHHNREIGAASAAAAGGVATAMVIQREN